MTINDILIILAVIAGPIMAVQIQKILEHHQFAKQRKVHIFKTLMATRASMLSPEHVQALNMIDFEFRESSNKPVRDAWKAYHDHLNSHPIAKNASGNNTVDPAQEFNTQQTIWSNKRDELLRALLLNMGKALGYDFNETQIKRSIYAPQGHLDIELENTAIRRGLANILSGRFPLKMEVTDFPATLSEEESKHVSLLRVKLVELLSGKENFRVEIMSHKDKAD